MITKLRDYLLNKRNYSLILFIGIVLLLEMLAIVIAITQSYYLYGTIRSDIVYIGLIDTLIVTICSGLFIANLFSYISKLLADNKMLQSTLQATENIDLLEHANNPLTQMTFSKYFEDQIFKSIHHKERLTCIVIRLNNYDLYLKTYGQKNINLVLLELNKILFQCKRVNDNGMHYLDGVFTILFVDTHPDSIQSICQRIQSLVQKQVFKIKMSDKMLTSNILNIKLDISGIEMIPNPDDTTDTLYKILFKQLEDICNGDYRFIVRDSDV